MEAIITAIPFGDPGRGRITRLGPVNREYQLHSRQHDEGSSAQMDGFSTRAYNAPQKLTSWRPCSKPWQ
ncbi:hypothetical protein COCOBI_19-0390 [Coccomyxa sp. Obi]|nr:hypothetical protein COCOBI_19-0390 [Coccomyxa sp. Obi]